MHSSVCGRVALVSVLLMGILSPASAGEAVTYRLTFISYWSSTSHPIDFPSDAHFSGLIGGTHHDGFVMWEPGELASPGIQRMAETGSKSPLDEEVMAAIDAGLADVLISGGSMPVSPGEVTVAFEIQESHPLVSVVTMVAPSPDWFVGVNGVSLRGAEGWIPNLTVDLLVWDSGTDSGETFTAPNEVTDPPVPIFEKDDYAFASGALIGQFVFSLVTVDVPEEAPAASRINLAPNPFRSELHVTVPGDQRATVDIFDASGRRVRRLVGAPGQRTIRWNALYEDGVQASAGVYWLRIRSGAGVETIRAVLAR